MRKLRGGYNVMLTGRPAAAVQDLPRPSRLVLPLRTPRLDFADLRVSEGQAVRPGDVLAVAANAYDLPLLAPLAGLVRTQVIPGHLVLENLQEGVSPAELKLPAGLDASAQRRYRLVARGAWTEFHDAISGRICDPQADCEAVIVSTLRLEPFLTRGDALLRAAEEEFFRGLEMLQSLLEYQPIYLVLPSVRSPFALHVRQRLRGLAYVKLLDVPLRYAFDDFQLLARHLGYRPSQGAKLWAVRAEGILAIERALGRDLPCTHRVVTLGGPAVQHPAHWRMPTGYPLDELLTGRLWEYLPAVRVLRGGVMTGQTLETRETGVDVECAGLTALGEPTEPEFWGWMRLGWTRRSYSRCFASSLRRRFPAPLTTAMHGDRRACIACGACEKVCPARIRPHLIHKALYADQLEEADALGVCLCVGCGLCSYVCPSKIELRAQMVDAQRRVEQELRVPADQASDTEAHA